LSSASHAAAPSADAVSPLLHQSFWPWARTPEVMRLVNALMASDQAALFGYFAEVAL
jgi:hypothetical protein